MCGIAGGTGTDEATVAEMVRRLRHRGPDGQGVVTHGGIVHGHARLSLVDLTAASDQPFRSGESVITFNGEVWNFRAVAAGHSGWTPRTTGDTEVLLKHFDAFGLTGLNDLDGMFAFAYSGPMGRWLVRDRFGEVPLYVVRQAAGRFLWASELKAFASRPLAAAAVAVPPGHALDLDAGRFVRWHRPASHQLLAVDWVRNRLKEGVASRLSADAPVCLLASGGMDSTLILALAKEAGADATAYTAVFDPASEDLAAARRVCGEFGIRLVEVPIPVTADTVRDAVRTIEVASKAQVEIAVPCLALAARMRADGFKACLSGEGADELFGGYGNFCIQAAQPGADVPAIRAALVAKMGRGNFVRCNKAFMAHGIECRLPFLQYELTEAAVRSDLTANPPGKKLLKAAAAGLIPDWVIRRQKDTFQGGSGVAAAVAKLIANPIVYYNAEVKTLYGRIDHG